MKIVRNMLGRLVNRLRSKQDSKDFLDLNGEKGKAIVMLHERMNGLERKINSHRLAKPTSIQDPYIEMDLLLQSEIRSRERLERKLTKTTRKMDHLAAEFNVLQCQLKTSTVDLDLERRKNAELRKRLNNHPVRVERRVRFNEGLNIVHNKS